MVTELTADTITDEHFEVAEQIAQFVLEQAHEWEHVGQVHDALVEIARRIRVADWTPAARAECARILNARSTTRTSENK